MITRYIATSRYYNHRRTRPASKPYDISDLVGGGGSLSLFKTLRNAVECAGPSGAVWLFELARLPRIAFDRFVVGTPEYRALERARARSRDLSMITSSFGEPVPLEEQIKSQLAAKTKAKADSDRDELYRQFIEAEQQMAMWSERALKLERVLNGVTG
jgi:hypothetical protein